jgi:D-3-phosphoglycerate dehydrogenase / 2-oxoglutarate reductase
MSTVVLTDHAWPDATLELAILSAAGHRLVAQHATASAAQVEAVVAAEQPQAIMTCWAPVSDAAIASAASLRIVARMGVGLDNIGVAEATRRGIWVTNVPDYCVEEVSDHAVALALAWLRGVVVLDRQVRSGTWNPGGARLSRLCTRTAGIIGYGRIGHLTAHKLAGLGLRVLALPPRTSAPAPGAAELVDLDTLLKESDVLILHVPLTPETHHLVDAVFLARVRPGALLVNASRGGLVDSAALVEALDRGPLGAAALDVVESEPNPPKALVARDNVIITPHVGFSSDISVQELRRRASEEVVRVLSGQMPQFPCNDVRA